MIFIILLFIKIVSFPLFLLIWFDFYLYLSIYALKEWEDFRLIYKGFTRKVGYANWIKPTYIQPGMNSREDQPN